MAWKCNYPQFIFDHLSYVSNHHFSYKIFKLQSPCLIKITSNFIIIEELTLLYWKLQFQVNH